MKNYILHGKAIIEETNFLKWAKWFGNIDNRVVSYTELPHDISISTVFLGIDHNFSRNHNSKPVLFETMVFGGLLDGYQVRYCTWDEAENGHREIVTKVILSE